MRSPPPAGGLFCLWISLLPLLAAAPARAEPPAEPLARRVRFLEAEVERLRREGRLSAEALKRGLLARFPLSPESEAAARADLRLLLQAVIRAENLDTRGYNEPRPGGAGYEPPEDVATARKVYNIDLFNALLDRNGRLEPAADAGGRTALMYAAEANRFEVLRTLILLPGRRPFEPLYAQQDAAGRPYIDWCDKDGYTALMHAAAANSVEAVNYLINAGASPDTRCLVARFDALQLAQNAGHTASADAIERKLGEKPAWFQFVEENGVTLAWAISLLAVVAGLWRFCTVFRRRWREAAGKTGGSPSGRLTGSGGRTRS